MPTTLPTSLAGRDLVTLASLSTDQIEAIFDAARAFKADPARFRTALAGRAVVMIFEKPSLRTRLSFEVGIARLGGTAVYYDQSAQRIGERESIKDYARNLERWVDAIIARVFSQEVVEELARHAEVPVINALSDMEHPCQALADYFTLVERVGNLRGLKLAYVGDGNNVCHSLLIGAGKLGVRMTVVTPKGAEPNAHVVALARSLAEVSGGEVRLSNDAAAVAGADAVYTDTWTSMGAVVGGAEAAAKRERLFRPYQVNAQIMAKAGAKALFMHCLPAHRGMEVTDEVIDSPNSVVYDQAENRMHAQNGLLMHILAPSAL